MSTIVVLTPIIIGSWPAISGAAAAAAAALGLMAKQAVEEEIKQHQTQQVDVEETVEVELAESEVLAQSLASQKELVFTRGDIELRVGRDERGRCRVCAKGKGHTKAELEEIAEQFTQKLTQCFIYNRVASELKSKGFQKVNEEVMDDESIRIHVRRFVE
jgi:hypothetical protein